MRSPYLPRTTPFRCPSHILPQFKRFVQCSRSSFPILQRSNSSPLSSLTTSPLCLAHLTPTSCQSHTLVPLPNSITVEHSFPPFTPNVSPIARFFHTSSLSTAASPSSFSPACADYEDRIRASFAAQGAMHLLGASLSSIAPGEVEIELPYRPDLSQQHGFFHAGVAATVADSAGGYAAFSLFDKDSSVLSVEFKINLLSPMDGERLFGKGTVRKGGRTLSVCDLEVTVEKQGKRKTCAVGLLTAMRIPNTMLKEPGQN